MKQLNDFKKKLVDRFSEKLTDKVFLMIQNDRDLMREYLAVIENSKSLAYVNSEIAKEVKKRYDLQNLNQRNENPESLLIQGHEMFETK
ncbi:hypothetical protein [Labilibaculum euxinus]